MLSQQCIAFLLLTHKTALILSQWQPPPESFPYRQQQCPEQPYNGQYQSPFPNYPISPGSQQQQQQQQQPGALETLFGAVGQFASSLVGPIAGGADISGLAKTAGSLGDGILGLILGRKKRSIGIPKLNKGTVQLTSCSKDEENWFRKLLKLFDYNRDGGIFFEEFPRFFQKAVKKGAVGFEKMGFTVDDILLFGTKCQANSHSKYKKKLLQLLSTPEKVEKKPDLNEI